MSEKLFKKIRLAGIWNLVIGIVVLITGITSGILMLISAARLLRSKDEVVI